MNAPFWELLNVMYFKIISYLKFLLKSTNEHGVHSPFVFNFVTKCLYSKKKFHSNKTINVLLKSIDYFHFENVQITAGKEKPDLVKKVFPGLNFDENVLDFLFVDQIDPTVLQKWVSEGKLHNDSMVLVNGIHQNKRKWDDWKNLIQLPQITVSMDMYHCGAIFIRKEQMKEHFTIRI